MDVFKILFLQCTEHPVIVDGKEIPLWKITQEDIEKGRVDFNLPWKSLQELVIYLYKLASKHKKSGNSVSLDALPKFPVEKILVGIAFLESEVPECMVDPRTSCLEKLDSIIITRVNILSKYYFRAKKPLNTTIFDEVILKFPQKKNVKGSMVEIREIIGKLRNLEFDL